MKYIVRRSFKAASSMGLGRWSKGQQLDSEKLDFPESYLNGLVKLGLISPVSGGEDTNVTEEDTGIQNAPESETESLGALDEDEGDLKEEDVTEDEEDDGIIPAHEVLSDTPITDAINAVAEGDKDGLKAIIDANNSSVKKNSGFTKMKSELLAEFEGK